MPITPYAMGRTQDSHHSVCHRRKLGRPAPHMPWAEARASSATGAVGGNTAKRLCALRPHVPVPAYGCPPLPPHSVPDAFPRSHAPVLAPASQNHPPQVRPL